MQASAAQTLPVTKTCSQCGAILPSSVRACQFCDSSFSVGPSAIDQASDIRANGNLALQLNSSAPELVPSGRRSASTAQTIPDAAWRGELAQRLKAYRTRRRRHSPNEEQSSFSFDETPGKQEAAASVAIEEPPVPVEDDFYFTIAIGRPSKKLLCEESRMEIDVSLRPDPEICPQEPPAGGEKHFQSCLYPVASIEDRRLAAIIDLFCLLFAYGGFLGLFGSLGGHFTLSKLSAAVCATTFAIVYLQYFALFTIFGGTTPGMMMRRMQVVSFSGEPPEPKQMLLRSAGYLLSAGTFFLGFLWALWDEDELTWHDRLSRTYLSTEQTLADIETSDAAHSR